MDYYDVVVVGRGLVGSAAAKYLAFEGKRVALIGPGEEDRDVRGCHADEGRITRTLDPDPVWAELAARSIERYEEIAKASGVSFHEAVGCLAVGRAAGAYLRAVSETASRSGASLERLTEKSMASRWPHLRLDASLLGEEGEFEGLYEPPPAGHVSPRRLLAAQLEIFRLNGGIAIDDVVDRVDPRGIVSLRGGRTLEAAKVLVATNAWTNFRPLLPRRVVMRLTTQTAVCRRVSGDGPSMPALIIKGGAAPFGVENRLDACYVLPPIAYGDETYVKIGHGSFFEKDLSNERDALGWYEGRNDDPSDDLAALLARLLKDGDADDVRVVRCVIPKTPTKRPYMHLFSPRLGCCVGCNGYAAKSSDELGRLAADMLARGVAGDWGPRIPADAFQVVFEEEEEGDDDPRN
ncbi:hypothetical protein CTAYLR_001778 [Chrysophaeum taylorii]|uniref:FAD dependent oxidoreductase domain-containing protein n=1 Tax=Chrysophaeum taylorii TaxID=2483200 RepID=A0AAD7UH98_9STRA|nr:hypothetical protein CTAYLR_001778 [Chrysophaeum taylorii]